MNCVNINNPEFKKLLEESKLSSLELETFISNWQDKVKLDRFPSLNEIFTNDLELTKKEMLVDLQRSIIPKKTSDIGLSILSKDISKANDRLKHQGIQRVYKIENKVRIGQSADFTFDVKVYRGNLNVEDKNNRKLYSLPTNQVNAGIKSIDILQSTKADEIFRKGDKNNWDIDKILTELLIPKEQKELIKSFNTRNREEILTNLLANYSYTVEINTAKEKLTGKIAAEEGMYVKEENGKYYLVDAAYSTKNEISKQEYKDFNNNKQIPTKHYSNLTVPGGTNYTENEISTPLITPIIKGHAQFSTDNGIGWFRSDNYKKGVQFNRIENLEKKKQLIKMWGNDPKYSKLLSGNIKVYNDRTTGEMNSGGGIIITEDNNIYNLHQDDLEPILRGQTSKDYILDKEYGGELTKTRRILEVQSDLFQKGRDKEFLVDNYKHTPGDRNFNVTYEGKEYKVGTMGGMQRVVIYKTLEGQVHYENPKQDWLTQEEIPQGLKDIVSNKFNSLKQEVLTQNKSNKENQFLQLLNKDNNWVTFFVKSIIQDSAKKGYEKVLFPTGNTASKVEGHTTLEEFKKQKEDRIKKVQEQLLDNNYIESEIIQTLVDASHEGEIISKEEAKEVVLDTKNREINTLKQELERVEKEGFGALRPIYNFYENTVTNILKKNGYLPKIITDEYGNIWNEVEIKPEHLNKILFNKDLTVDKKNIIREEMITLYYDYAKANGIKIKFVDKVLDENGNDVNAFYDSFAKVIRIRKGLENLDVFPEELAHHLTLALGEDHVAVKRAFNLIGRLDYKGILGKEYVDAYNGDENLLKHEFLGKYIAKFLANPNLPNELNSENGIKLWDTIKNLLNRFISLFNPNFNIESRLEYLSKELGTKIVKGELVGDTDLFLRMYNKDSEKSKFDKLIDKDIRKQYVYYTGRVKKLERDSRNFDKDSAEYIKIKEEIDSIKEALREWTKNKNKQGIINLANNTLNVIQEYLNKVFSQHVENRKIDNIEETIKILNLFKDLEGVMDRVPTLLKQAKELGKQSILTDLGRVLNKEVKLDIFDEIDTDMFVGGTWFGTLSDIKNKLGKAIGLLIKEAQAKVERKNKDSYNELNAKVEALQKYQNSKGLKGQDIYSVFIQSYRGTTVITKPYTTEFYDKIQDSFKSENGKELRKSFASYDDITKSWIPKDKVKYGNKNYQKIQNTPELKAFYDYFKGEIKKINDKLPVQKDLNEDFIPNVFERSLVDIFKSDKDIMAKLGDSVNHILETNDWGKEATYLFDEALEKDQVPLKYLGSLPEDVKSKDLGAALLKFMYFANSYEHMSEILPKTRLLQEIIQEQEFVKSGDPTTSISGATTNINTMVEAFIKMQVLGEMKKDNEKAAPYIDAAIKYTSLLRIGLNPFNAITNAIIGNIGNLVEASGGKYYNVKQYLQATKIFSMQNMDSDSKLHKMIELFNPLMELEDYENLKNIRVGSEQYKEKIKSLMYYPQRIGEKQLQTSTMIALMLNTKVKTKDGSEINMWEAFDESGKWNTELMGYELTEDMIFKTTNKIQRINQMIHGRYSAKDAAAATQYSLFRAAFQFKKWIPAAIEARFGDKRYDDRLGEEIEGRYHSYVKGFKFMLAKLKGDIDAIEANKFTELDIYNMRKNSLEVLLIVSTMLMAWGFDDDKKRKDPSYKYMMNQLNQISGDLLFFYNPNKIVDTAAGSIPVAKTMKDLYKAIENIPAVFTGEKYVKGRYKGENKELAAIVNLTPIVKPIADVARLWNKDSYVKK